MAFTSRCHECCGISLLPRHGLLLDLVGVSVIAEFFTGWGDKPQAQPPTWRARDCPLSGPSPLTNPAWLNLPGARAPAGIALGIIETRKLHHHDKATSPGEGVTVKTGNYMKASLTAYFNRQLERSSSKIALLKTNYRNKRR